MKVYIDKEFEELIPIFLENQHKLMDSLDKAVIDEDFETLAFLGHRMAGTAENYGFSEIGKIARVIELIALKSTVEGVKEYCDEIKDYLEHMEIEYIVL